MSDDNGLRTLNDGLLFSGITFDDKQGDDRMEIRMGIDVDHHQTHNIDHPHSVMFEPAKRGPGGTLDIEDRGGEKTMIEFRRPRRMLIEYVQSEILVAG